MGQGVSDASLRQEVAERLRAIGVTEGILVQMAQDGQIVEVSCEMPECYCPMGREHFDVKSHPPSEWILTPDHYPKLESDGGILSPDNVRLAHLLCNRVNFGWRERIRPMLVKRMSLEEIAGELNREKVRAPHGTNEWTAAMVRKAFSS